MIASQKDEHCPLSTFCKERTMAKKKAKKSRDTLVVGSKIKSYIKENKFMCSGELIENLSNKVYDILDDAMDRTELNRRSTVRPQDL